MTPLIHRPLRSRFLRSEEGPIFVLGCCMLLLWVAVAAALFQLKHPRWLDVLTVGLAHMVAGKPVSIAQGLQAGMPSPLIAFLAIYADTTALFIIYPVLVFCYRNFFENRFFQAHMKPVFDKAQANINKLRRFKIVGIFVFVWFPFWMTGVIVGAVLGFLVGLRTWITLATVIAGTTTAVVCWVYAYDQLFGWLGFVNERIPDSLILVLLLALVAYRIVSKRREAAARLRRVHRGDSQRSNEQDKTDRSGTG